MGNFEPLKMKHYLLVDVAGKRFAFDTKEIDNIHTSNNAVSNDGIEDMKAAVRIHKKVIPIINLRQKFVLKTKSDLPYFPTIIFLKSKSGGETTIIGVQVDMILEVVEINQLHIKPNKYGYATIKHFAHRKIESIPLIHMRDIIIEQESSLLETEMLN